MAGLWEGSLSGLLDVSSHDRQRKQLWSFPLHVGPTLTTSLKPNYLPKVPQLNTITLRVRMSTYEFEIGNRIRSIAMDFYILIHPLDHQPD